MLEVKFRRGRKMNWSSKGAKRVLFRPSAIDANLSDRDELGAIFNIISLGLRSNNVGRHHLGSLFTLAVEGRSLLPVVPYAFASLA